MNTQHQADSGVRTRILAADGLTKTYKGANQPALSNFSIAINAGDIFGLLGPNGAGKTTAISLFSTLLKPGQGNLRICGMDALKHPNRVKHLIGLVPQDIALYVDLTANENLLYFGRLYGLKGQRLNERIQACLELVGLTNKEGKTVATYSGGMKRRLNLAVGILHQPRILFLDEPTVGIDAQSRNMILERLHLLRQSGTTMIYTTHYMEEAEQLCNTVAIIDEGRIIAQGDPQQLVQGPPCYASLGELFLAMTGKRLRD